MSTVTLNTAPRSNTTAASPTDQQVQSYLRTGLRNRWWPILPSRFVEAGGKPVGLTRLGESMVLWRDAKGAIHVQADRCPHRAVPLSRGINEGDRLRCNYHGVEVGPDGRVLKVPGQPGCPLEGKKAVKTYPSCDVAGRDLCLVRRRAASGCAGICAAAATRRRRILPVPLLRGLGNGVALCFRQSDGSDARHVPACQLAHDVSGRHQSALRHPRYSARLLLREGRPARRELRLERAGR